MAGVLGAVAGRAAAAAGRAAAVAGRAAAAQGGTPCSSILVGECIPMGAGSRRAGNLDAGG